MRQVNDNIEVPPKHKAPWPWQVPAYLVTKAIASGTFLVMPLLWRLGPPAGIARFLQGDVRVDFTSPANTWGGDSSIMAVMLGVILLFLLITGVLLVTDLERPERFLRILTRPQWKSWLTGGAFVLVAFTCIVTLWFALELGRLLRWWPSAPMQAIRDTLALFGWPLALLTAVYTAFLFVQRKGRELWQSRWMGPHMLIQAVAVGSIGHMLISALDSASRSAFVAFSAAWLWMLAMGSDLAFRWIETRLTISPSQLSRRSALRLLRTSTGHTWRASWLTAAAVCVPIFATTAMEIAKVMWLGASRPGYVGESALVSYWMVPLQVWFKVLVRPLEKLTPASAQPVFYMAYVTAAAAVFLGGYLVSFYLYEYAIVKAGQDMPIA